jgi:hypothetical protein
MRGSTTRFSAIRLIRRHRPALGSWIPEPRYPAPGLGNKEALLLELLLPDAECRLCSARDKFALCLSQADSEAKGDRCRLGVVYRQQIDPRVAQIQRVLRITGESIQFGDDQSCTFTRGQFHRATKARSVPILSTANVTELADILPVCAGNIFAALIGLGFQTEAGSPLLFGAHASVDAILFHVL